MFHEPKTKAEAEKHRYGTWAGNPRGVAYDELLCAAAIIADGDYWTHQCIYKNGKGPNGLYCGMHAKKVKT